MNNFLLKALCKLGYPDWKTTLLNSLFGVYVLSLFCLLIWNLIYEVSPIWLIEEFMINYQGGFVRRGLIGEVLFFLHQHCGINVYWTAKIASLIFYSIVCGFFVIAFRKKGYALYLIPLCFFCGALIGWGYWIRKDALMLCILIATLLIWNSNRRSFSPILRIIAINLLSVFILLVHECFAFFALPLLFLLIFHHYRNKGFWRSGFLSSLSLLPALGAFLLLLWKHGDAETALTIWNSWQTTLSNEVPAGAIQAIGWTTKDAIAFHIEQNFLGSTHEGFSVFHWVTIFPAIYYVLINTLAVFKKQPETYTENHRAILSLILLFQFVCMIPLFTILACDYDRSFFYLTASSFALFLIIPMKTLEGLFPPIVYGLANKINKGLDNLLLPSKTMVVFLMLIINVPPQANSILSQLCLSFSEIFLFAGSFIRTIFGS